MKKIHLITALALLISMSFVGLFTGCSKEADANVESEVEQTAEVVIKDNTTVMDGVILVGIDIGNSPYIEKNDNGLVEGFEIDLANAIGELTLSDVKFVEIDRSSGFAELDISIFDCIISAVSISDDIDKVYDFSVSYLTDENGYQYAAVVKTGNNRLLNVLNQSISILKSDGRLDAIYNKWFGNEDDNASEGETSEMQD